MVICSVGVGKGPDGQRFVSGIIMWAESCEGGLTSVLFPDEHSSPILTGSSLLLPNVPRWLKLIFEGLASNYKFQSNNKAIRPHVFDFSMI